MASVVTDAVTASSVVVDVDPSEGRLMKQPTSAASAAISAATDVPETVAALEGWVDEQ